MPFLTTPWRRAIVLALAAGTLAAPFAYAKKPSPKNKTAADAALSGTPYGQREDVMRFGAELAARQQLDAATVQARLAEARMNPTVARLIMPPPAGTAKSWAAYRSRFVEPRRIRAGLAFWNENQAWLKRAEETYGVPAELIVGVIGVETIYGQQMGDFRVIDALATLSFDFPTGRKDRSAFFRDELEQLFVLSQRGNVDALSLKGSYAGAMGLGQFMPSSWNKYAIDFDGDGQIDMRNSAADVIGSIAHYFEQYGWQRGQPTRFSVAPPVDSTDRAFLLGPDIVPSFTSQEFTAKGASLEAAAREFSGKLALVELQNGDAAPTYVAGTANFYVVTRYNWSSYYAMAVLDLGQAVAQIKQSLAR